MRSRMIAIATLLMVGGYGVVWHMQAGAVRDHVESSLLALRQTFKHTNSNVRIQWDAIERSGFPFSPSATITAPTLSMVHQGASYSVGFTQLTFAPGGVAGTSREGVYYMFPPTNQLRAVYAEDGSAPENYFVDWDNPVEIKLLAYNPDVKPQRCMPGDRCISLPSEDYPLSHMRVRLPNQLMLLAQLGDKKQQIQFRFNDLQRAAVALDYPIPADVTYPLSIFVGMLREALIYN